MILGCEYCRRSFNTLKLLWYRHKHLFAFRWFIKAQLLGWRQKIILSHCAWLKHVIQAKEDCMNNAKKDFIGSVKLVTRAFGLFLSILIFMRISFESTIQLCSMIFSSMSYNWRPFLDIFSTSCAAIRRILSFHNLSKNCQNELTNGTPKAFRSPNIGRLLLK